MVKFEKLSCLGKYLDQPALVKKVYKFVPPALVLGAAGYGLYDTFKQDEKNRKNKFIQDFCVLSSTVLTALVATRGLKIKGKQIFDGLIELPHLHEHDVEEVLTKVGDSEVKNLILKVKEGNILKLKEVKELMTSLKDDFKEKGLINKVIPGPHSHKPFEELKNLSILGLIPVLGGIAGGIVGDKLTDKNWKSKVSNKVKEGSYQYLNNIFLCNVGAGLALLLMNKLNVKSKAVRFCSMIAGVLGVGLVAGSSIANFIGKTLINPLFDKKNKNKIDYKEVIKDLNSERKPEALDVSLHVDDLASVGFITGLKWIGPVLPVLYSVSGYRAGIGYRNHKTNSLN